MTQTQKINVTLKGQGNSEIVVNHGIITGKGALRTGEIMKTEVVKTIVGGKVVYEK